MRIHYGTVSNFKIRCHTPGINPLLEITGDECGPRSNTTIEMYVGADDALQLIKELREHLKKAGVQKPRCGNSQKAQSTKGPARRG